MCAPVGYPGIPIINDIIKYIKTACKISVAVQSAGQAPVPSSIVGQQVVMKASHITAYAGGISVSRPGRIIFMSGHVQCFGDQCSLQRDVQCTP